MLLLLEAARGTAHIIHQPVLTRERLLVTRAGLGWQQAMSKKPVSRSQLLGAIQAPVTQRKKRHFVKWGFSQMTGKESPPHTPYSLTALNWHSFKSWDGPRAADSKTLGIRTQDWKVFVPSWLVASFPWRALPAHAECQPAEQEHLCKEAPSILANEKNPRFALLQRRKGWSRVVELLDRDKGSGIDKAVHSCSKYSRHRGVFSRKDF